MSIDRRIVSILYYNDITDVNSVEEFIGENNGYYEVKVNGIINKLKLPGENYFENVDDNIDEIKQQLLEVKNDELKIKKEEIAKLLNTTKNDEPYFNEDIINKNILNLPVDIDESLNLVVEQSKIDCDIFETTITTTIKNIDDEEKLIEKIVIDDEDKIIVKKQKSIFKKTSKKSLDDDNEFITSI